MSANTAFLIDPTGKAPELMDEAVYRILLSYLNLPDGCPACDAVEWLLRRASETPDMNTKEVLRESLSHYANSFNDGLTAGILANVRTGKSEDLTKIETEILENTLVAIRAGGWFPRWVGIQLDQIVHNKNAAERFPTPLQIAGSLNWGWLEEYEEEMEQAREIARMRPDLLLASSRVASGSQAPSSGIRQTAMKRPAKAPKPRKKAVRAS